MIHKYARTILLGLILFCSATAFAAGTTGLIVKQRIFNQQEFAKRSTELLHHHAVQSALTTAIVDGAIDSGSADLISARPLLESVVGEITKSKPFSQLLYTSATKTHQLVFANRSNEEQVLIDLTDAAAITKEALQSVSPRLAKKIPNEFEPELLRVTLPSEIRAAHELQTKTQQWSFVAFGVGFLLLLFALILERNWRARAITLCATITLSALSLGAYLTLVRKRVLEQIHGSETLTEKQARNFVSALWETYLGDLTKTTFMITALTGAVFLVLLTNALPAAKARTRNAIRSWWFSSGTKIDQISVSCAVVAVGALMILQPSWLLSAQMRLVGVVLAALGVAKLTRKNQQSSSSPLFIYDWKPLLVGLLSCATVFLFTTVASSPQAKPKQAHIPTSGCNGIPELCKLRVNEVVFPGTHNSMSAGDEDGWYFANQRYSITRQLEDGIRLFLIDPHYGFLPAGKNIVRTDLEREGSSRNRVAAHVNPRALRLAEQLAGRIGLGEINGKSRPYLCHTLCELGSLDMVSALDSYRTFLKREPGAVVVLFLESSIDPKEIEDIFRQTRLLPYTVSLDREQPLPTLGELVKRNRRLIVLSERETDGLSWYAPGFSFVQDTPLGKTSTRSCRLARGSIDSPLLMVNHWVDSFPPPRNANRRIGTSNVLLERLRRCERERNMPVNLFAVDHYDTGKIVQIAKTVNLQRIQARK